MNLANEVSSMQTELESLRADNHVLKRQNEMLEFEKDQLTRALAKASAERDHHMVKKGQLKALIDNAGQVLIAGLRKYHDEIAQSQEVDKALQTAQEVKPQATPLFIPNKAAE